MARPNPHFFKVYFPHLSSDYLKIPPVFREYIEHESPGIVSLKGPSGKTWNVELVKSSKGLLFENGWKEFVADHALELGDFLVFRYDGGLHFSVLVFDATACEKAAAFLARPCDGHITVLDGGDEGEILGEHDSKALILTLSQTKLTSIGSLVIQGPPSEEKRQSPSNEVEMAEIEVMSEAECSKMRKLKSKIPDQKDHSSSPSGALASTQRSNAMGEQQNEANLLSSPSKVHENAARVKASHKKSTVSSRYTDIVNKAKTERQRGRPAKTSHSATSMAKSLSKKLVRVSKSSASKQSSQGSKRLELLKCNDVPRRGEAVAKVRRMPSLISQRRPVTKEEMNKTLEQANSFKSKNPFVHVVMQESYVYVSFFLNIPYAFARQYLPKVSKKMTLWDPNGKPWAVSYVSYSSRGGFSAGWGGFSYANNLEKYDVCVFELIKRNHMKVHIFRVVKEIAPLIQNSKCKS